LVWDLMQIRRDELGTAHSNG